MTKLMKKRKDNVNWQDVIVDYKRSHLTQRQFCLERDLNIGRFGYWYRRYKKDNELKGLTDGGDAVNKSEIKFVELNVLNDHNNTGIRDNNHTSLPPKKSYLTLKIDNRFKIRLPVDFDERILSKLVKVISV